MRKKCASDGTDLKSLTLGRHFARSPIKTRRLSNEGFKLALFGIIQTVGIGQMDILAVLAIGTG